MTDNQALTLTDVDKRLSNLEKEGEARSRVLDEMTGILKKIERVLIGDLDTTSMGLVNEVRDLKGHVVELKAKIVVLEKVTDEINRWKWMVRLLGLVLASIVAYALQIWKLFIK